MNTITGQFLSESEAGEGSSSAQLKEFVDLSHADMQLCLSTIRSRLPDGLLPEPQLAVLAAETQQSLAKFHLSVKNVCDHNRTDSGGDHCMWVLPSELTEKILSVLPLHERKTARLVCKDWRAMTWSRTFIQNDWITVTVDDKQQSLKTVIDALRKVYGGGGAGGDGIPINLRFKPLLCDSPSMSIEEAADEEVWQLFGPKLENLLFAKGCRGMTSAFLSMILEHCTSLKSFSYLGSFAPGEKNHSWPAGKMIKIRNNLESLRELKMTKTTKLEEADPLWELITNLRELKIQSVNKPGYDYTPDDDENENVNDDSAKLESVLNGVSACELSVSSVQNNLLVARKVNSLLQQKRFPLKGVRLCTERDEIAVEFCRVLDARRDSIEQFSYRRSSSRKWDYPDHLPSALFGAVLSLQNLKRLSLCYDVGQTEPLDSVARLAYAALLRLSHLTALHLKCVRECEPISENLFADMPALPADLPLQELKIHNAEVCAQLFVSRHGTPVTLTKLKTLKLSKTWDFTVEMLQHICETSTDLESLTLHRCHMFGDTAPVVDLNTALAGPFLAKLSHLKELSIDERFTNTQLRQLRFSDHHSLKSLSLEVTECSDETLLCIADAHRDLETFSLTKSRDFPSHFSVPFLDFSDVSLNGQLEFIRRCTRLRNFNSDLLTADAVLRKQMKEMCPSLHSINGFTLLD